MLRAHGRDVSNIDVVDMLHLRGDGGLRDFPRPGTIRTGYAGIFPAHVTSAAAMVAFWLTKGVSRIHTPALAVGFDSGSGVGFHHFFFVQRGRARIW